MFQISSHYLFSHLAEESLSSADLSQLTALTQHSQIRRFALEKINDSLWFLFTWKLDENPRGAFKVI